MQRLLIIPLLCLALVPAVTHAAHPRPAWYACRIAVNAHGRLAERACYTIPMVRHHRRVVGWTIRRARLSRDLIRSVRYPRFATRKVKAAPVQAAPHTTSLWLYVTGYSWGCGTPNNLTASGTIPAVGTVASDVLPMGTHVYVPSLGYSGTVLDRGAPMDLFAADCAATYAYTGYRLVYVTAP